MCEEIIKKFYKERNIKESTMKGYDGAFKQYLLSQSSSSMEDLLKEAVKEQKNRIPLPETRLKQRLLQFRQYLIDQNYATHTVTTYFSKVISFYMHMDITIPQIKQAKLEKPYVSSYDDLPTKEELIKAFKMAKLPMKAFITFQLSSGQARAEACSLTVEQFLKACSEYCDTNLPLLDQVKQLSLRDDVVPLFYLKRLKTGVYYYTCCGPEAVYFICKELLSRKDVQPDDALFDMSYSYVCTEYKKLNDGLGLGRVGYYRKIRSHVIRKWHATMLPLSPEEIDMLQGRTRSDIHETYIKLKPDRIKQMYMSVMNQVMLFPGRWMKGTNHEIPTGDTTYFQPPQPSNQSMDVSVYKEIGKLEARIEMLEQRLKKLED